MPTDYAVHSDFLIHWTGGHDIDYQLEPEWDKSDSKDEPENKKDNNKKFKNNNTPHPAAAKYLDRLRDILKYGLWMTVEKEEEIIGRETDNELNHYRLKPVGCSVFRELRTEVLRSR